MDQFLNFHRSSCPHGNIGSDPGQNGVGTIPEICGMIQGILIHAEEQIVQKFGIAAAMSGFIVDIVSEDFRFAPERLEQNFRCHVISVTRFVPDFPVAERGEIFPQGSDPAFDHKKFQTAFGAVEADPIAFVGTMGTKGVVHDHIVLITDHYTHIVFNINPVRENALIPDISIVFFIFKVQLVKIRAFGYGKCKGIFLCCRIIFCPGVKFFDAPLFSIFPAVKFQIPHRIDCFRPGLDPPVDQVEVMGGFVDHQAAGIPFVPVPASEIIRPVIGVQKPFKVDAGQSPANPAGKQFPDFSIAWTVTVVERDGIFFPVFFWVSIII